MLIRPPCTAKYNRLHRKGMHVHRALSIPSFTAMHQVI